MNCLLHYGILVTIVMVIHIVVLFCVFGWFINALMDKWLEQNIGSRQLWKLSDDGILRNKYFPSNKEWKWEIKNELICIKENSTQCLEATNEGNIKENLGKIILGDIEEGNRAQLWKRGDKNTEGYLTLENCKGHKLLTASPPRLFSDNYLAYESGFECIYGNVFLPCNFRFYLDRSMIDGPYEHYDPFSSPILNGALKTLGYLYKIVFFPAISIHKIYANLMSVLSPTTMIEQGRGFFNIREQFQSMKEDFENEDEQFQKKKSKLEKI